MAILGHFRDLLHSGSRLELDTLPNPAPSNVALLPATTKAESNKLLPLTHHKSNTLHHSTTKRKYKHKASPDARKK
jgi:hypothetical protein